MYPQDPLRICTSCRIPHYENCPDCVGWGRYRSINDGKPYPVQAAEAHGEAPPSPKLEPCPTCGSTIKGVPETNLSKVRASAAKVMRVFRSTFRRLS